MTAVLGSNLTSIKLIYSKRRRRCSLCNTVSISVHRVGPVFRNFLSACFLRDKKCWFFLACHPLDPELHLSSFRLCGSMRIRIRHTVFYTLQSDLNTGTVRVWFCWSRPQRFLWRRSRKIMLIPSPHSIGSEMLKTDILKIGVHGGPTGIIFQE